MRHNPTDGFEKCAGKQGKPLGAVQVFQAPNVVVLTRCTRPPVPSLQLLVEDHAPADVSASTGGGKTELRGMSRKSSLNLSRMLSVLDWAKNGPCLHVSLTYARVWPEGKSELQRVKAKLTVYVERMGLCGVWRLEFQERLAPHFHLLLWCGELDPESVAFRVTRWWKEFSGNWSRFGCKVTAGDQARGVWYLAMHAAKLAQTPPFAVGRWWGYIDRERVLSASDLQRTRVLEERERVWWARLYRRSTGCRPRNGQGLSWFLPRSWQCEVAAWVSAQVDRERSARR